MKLGRCGGAALGLLGERSIEHRIQARLDERVEDRDDWPGILRPRLSDDQLHFHAMLLPRSRRVSNARGRMLRYIRTVPRESPGSTSGPPAGVDYPFLEP